MCQARFAVWIVLMFAGVLPTGAGERVAVEMPAFRVDADGFGADESDIRALLASTGRELWRYFADYRISPMVIKRGRNGPITLYQKNEHGEIVICLDTERTYWSQYAYQFAHEFCHVLCGFREGPRQNKWFEETLCETASLYAMRAMARSWRKDPPYPHWKDYRDSLRAYADDVIRKREAVDDIVRQGLPMFYGINRAALERDATLREINGGMSVVLLDQFERTPEAWESIRWINASPAVAGDSFRQYLQKWQAAAPSKHRPFIRRIAALYGIEIAPG